MKIQTFSIVAGSEACNARCPFCISKMTVTNGMTLKEPEVNWRNFKKACRLAQLSGCTTAMITSKGEPTLFRDQVTRYLENLSGFDIPIVEIQTNGIPIAEAGDKFDVYLREWYRLGLTTVAISVVHYDSDRNHEIYLPYKQSYIDLPGLIKRLHSHGLSVRLVCTMLKGFIDTTDEITNLVSFAKDNKVEQLTLRPVNKPDESVNRDQVAYDWTAKHFISDEQMRNVKNWLDGHTKLMSLMHGATVYDVEGQNVCLTSCLTRAPEDEDIRQLIFFPDGHLRYDWQYEGAILL